MFLNDMLESRIKRKVKIWTLGNSVYVTWNHNTITVWKFAQKTSIKSQSAKNKNGRNRRGKNDKKTLNDKNDAGKVKVDTKVVKNQKNDGRNNKVRKEEQEEVAFVKKSDLVNGRAKQDGPRARRNQKKQNKVDGGSETVDDQKESQNDGLELTETDTHNDQHDQSEEKAEQVENC